MYGQQFARLEDQLLGPLGELEEVAHSAGLTAELDDVAPLHGGRSDFDGVNQCTAGGLGPHAVTFTGTDGSGVEWHGQMHSS
ncbi:hypothetical protein WQO_17665 [Streptomyces globisporus C-1027]|uniref:Uncharacterized protein n=1 Tax=Streptomyces globisporus C-1027 TaxID=1172567 RepID=A0A0U3KK43_STRGL|nr:hypothetical protein WQO_17665 [Streptomyces globisporus C-1027]